MSATAHPSDARDVRIAPALAGVLGVPRPARGLVLFAHGSGSGRRSPRNSYVAAALREAGLATLLFDLLTESEAADRDKVFDTELLAGRLDLATRWARQQDDLAGLPIGYFGASTGAAAALVAAARARAGVAAVVSRGGRPDMAGALLGEVRAPTLPIVGGRVSGVIAEPAGVRAAALPEEPRGRPRCRPPVRGAGRARPGDRARGIGSRAT